MGRISPQDFQHHEYSGLRPGNFFHPFQLERKILMNQKCECNRKENSSHFDWEAIIISIAVFFVPAAYLLYQILK